MTSIGETLRRERVRRNLDLDRISRELKISARLLGAIEDERFEKLPGGVFTKSFVRQYARYLGLDEDEIVGELQRTLEPDTPATAQLSEIIKPELEMSMPRVKVWEGERQQRFRWGSVLPALALVLVVMLVCSAVYTWWQRTRRPISAHDEMPVAAAQTRSQPVTTAPAPQAQPPKSETTQSAQPVSTPPPLAAAPAETAAPKPEPAQERPPAVPSSTPSNAPVQVQLKAEEPVWVSARTDGKYLFSGTLAANESRTVEANENVVLRLGNAGGLSITLNGKPIGPVGPKGQIRTVQLTPGGFQIVVPEPPKPASPTGPVPPGTGPGAPL